MSKEASSRGPHTVRVDLGERSYDVLVGAGLIEAVGPTAAAGKPSQAVVISETTVAPLYGEAVLASLRAAGLSARLAEPFPAGEPSKTFATVSAVLDDVLGGETPIDRKTLVVALGGGVPGDLAGFVAAIALRGVPFLQVPTSLLAMVDSSVGGKTGVDHATGKNLIGAFHQPVGVVADVDTLRTLPERELANGLAEAVKHGVIRDPSLFAFLEANAESLATPDFDAAAMADLVARNVAIKAAVVADDEREAGVRAHLNFGHTIGHAVETFVGYETIRHGEAVALGMVAETAIAVRRGLLTQADADRLTALLAKLQLPTRQPGLDTAALLDLMQHDKKTVAGTIRLVLPSAIGDVDIYADITDAELRDAVAALGGG